jgi:superfamily II DNA or RNA helicase
MTMSTVFNHDRALELLRAGSENPTADFRGGQPEAIQAVCKQGSRVLVVQKTGWGKSFVEARSEVGGDRSTLVAAHEAACLVRQGRVVIDGDGNGEGAALGLDDGGAAMQALQM